MNKTVFRLDKELSIIILSSIAILCTLLGSYGSINSFISFLFIFIKSIIFVLIPLSVYILERNNKDFKKVAGIYTGYFILFLLITVIASVSIVNGIVPKIWKFLYDLTGLVILLSSLLILIEQVLYYSELNSKVYKKTIMKIVYLVGNFVSYPFLMFINKKSKKENDEE